jgi:tetratricopeptide (TPR) repeat protein
MNVSLLLLSVRVASAATSPAVEAELAAVELRARSLAEEASRIAAPGPAGSYLTHDEAIIKFQDNLYLELIGDHGPAAEGFYALVMTDALEDDGLARDAEWYLAEALVGLGNDKTAAARFQLIVDDPSHPFRDDAVRRLLELYAQSGQREEFKALYDAEIATGRVTPTPLITYSLAKSFYQQGDNTSARAAFNEVPPDSAWFARARYFLGVMNVAEGLLDDARMQFEAVAALPVTTTDDRLVHDQALLAQGRLAYDRGDYLAAAEAYTLIEGDSRYQADKLYEFVWTSIRSERWHDALNNVEVFLLAFPDHAFAAELDLLQAHLNFQERNWDEALASYDQVIVADTPVRDRFATLSEPGPESDIAVREVLESTDGGHGLPPYALAMMRADPELGRAMDVFRDLERQRQDIEVSERLIAELGAYVNGGGGGMDRGAALVARADVIGARLTLVKIEADLELGPKDTHAALASQGAALEQRYAALTPEVLGGPAATADLDALYRDTSALADGLRAGRPSAHTDLRLSRVDAAWGSLDDTWLHLGGAVSGGPSADPAAFGALRSQFDQQVAYVSSERADYESILGEARQVALGLTRGGFGRLEQFFADSVLKADMGIVDVFWSQKLEVSDELVRVRGEKDAALADLERRFQLIDDRMGEPR